jgi:tetratricopeptide (TPR) repeat protein
MIRQTEVEEIIRLIHKGMDLELLSFELDIPIEQIQAYKEQLELRTSVKNYIKSGEITSAIEQLNAFVETTDNNIVERMMLIKLKAYAEKTSINEEEFHQIEEERKRIGLTKNIDEILEDLQIQIPKRKNSNLRKREKQETTEQKPAQQFTEETLQEPEELKEIEKPDYEKAIKKYEEEINKEPQKSINTRNLLAFAYFKAGRIEEARDELLSLIDEYTSYIAYRQLIHLEISEGNLEDAKLWAYDCLDKFPDSIDIRQQLISIARKEKDNKEIVKQLKDIIKINPNSSKSQKMLESIEKGR